MSSSLSRRRKIIMTSAAVAATAGLAGIGMWATAPSTAPRSEFSLLRGGTLNTTDLLGHVAIVNFWATSCVTCVAEMPQFVQLHNTLQPLGLRMVAVAMQYDKPEYITNFVRTRQLPFPIAFDANGEAARQWDGIQATPTTFLIDRKGQIVERTVGAPDFGKLESSIRSLMA